jgi:hypothetical protein
LAYCTNVEVASNFRNLTFGATTKLTDTEVDAWIAEADAEIDGRIGVKYVTPVTGAQSLLIIKSICTALVSDRVRMTLPNEPPSDALDEKDKGKNPVLAQSRAEAERKLRMIVDNKLLLPDADLVSSKDGVGSFASDNAQEHIFKRQQCPEPADQW